MKESPRIGTKAPTGEARHAEIRVGGRKSNIAKEIQGKESMVT